MARVTWIGSYTMSVERGREGERERGRERERERGRKEEEEEEVLLTAYNK